MGIHATGDDALEGQRRDLLLDSGRTNAPERTTVKT
jgi:hypothetical protein